MNFAEQGKIIAFELDIFSLKRDYSKQELVNLFNWFKELGIYNNLFLFTNNSWPLVSNFLKEQELNLGYLVSNLGSCVYNLTTEKKEKENFLDKEELKLVLRFSFFNDFIVIIHCAEKSFIFGFNYLSSQKQKLYLNLSQLKSLQEIKEVIENNSIYSLEILFEESNSEFRKSKIRDFLNKLLEFQTKIDYLVIDSIIYLFSKGNSKLDIIGQTMQIKQEEIKNNLIYSSWATPDIDLAINSFFWLSFLELEPFISKKTPNNLVIYLSQDIQTWIDWWEEHNYLWKENIFKWDWLVRKIKQTELSNQENNGNCFELNLFDGLLQSKEINKKLNTWELFQRKIFGNHKEGRITLFLWPEQLTNLLISNKFTSY